MAKILTMKATLDENQGIDIKAIVNEEFQEEDLGRMMSSILYAGICELLAIMDPSSVANICLEAIQKYLDDHDLNDAAALREVRRRVKTQGGGLLQ